jgi:hypothetical protein
VWKATREIKVIFASITRLHMQIYNTQHSC